MAFKKIDKEFQVTDSTVNVYGFRLLTSGYLMDEFKKNPIGFYMHGESSDCPRELGVLVKWDDFRIEGDKVFAKPVVNLSHLRGQQTVDEIEDGFLNGASVGKIIAIEISEDPSLMEPGQTGPTVVKWYNRELSLVDIPGNYNSLSLFDENGNAINLSDFKLQKNIMKQIFLTAEMWKAMNLADNSDQAAINAALQNLVTRAGTADALKTQLETALSDKTKAETDLTAFKKEAGSKEVKDLLDKALADKKVTKALSDKLAKQYEGKPDELKDLLADMQSYQPITEQIKKESQNPNAEKFKNLSFSELDRQGFTPFT
jgi:hypothetical protein